MIAPRYWYIRPPFLFLPMPKQPHLSPDVAPAAEPSSNGHRSKYDVTLDRLAAMSPQELRELGRRLRTHDAGEYMLKLLLAGYSAPKQPDLPSGT